MPNRILTTQELAQELAGGYSYIRTRNLDVKGLALRRDLNPDAPNTIIVGKGPVIERNAKLFLNSKKFVPTYIKNETNSWSYIGEYKAVSYSTDKATINKYRYNRNEIDVAGILFLESK